MPMVPQAEALAETEGQLALPPMRPVLHGPRTQGRLGKETDMTSMTFTKTAPPQWLLDMWKEIDDKTFGRGFDCFAEDAVCNLGVADWHGRETIRNNLRAFIDTGFTAYHEVVEYWDSPSLKIFHGTVAMTFDDPKMPPIKPAMCH